MRGVIAAAGGFAGGFFAVGLVLVAGHLVLGAPEPTFGESLANVGMGVILMTFYAAWNAAAYTAIATASTHFRALAPRRVRRASLVFGLLAGIWHALGGWNLPLQVLPPLLGAPFTLRVAIGFGGIVAGLLAIVWARRAEA